MDWVDLSDSCQKTMTKLFTSHFIHQYKKIINDQSKIRKSEKNSLDTHTHYDVEDISIWQCQCYSNTCCDILTPIRISNRWIETIKQFPFHRFQVKPIFTKTMNKIWIWLNFRVQSIKYWKIATHKHTRQQFIHVKYIPQIFSRKNYFA